VICRQPHATAAALLRLLRRIVALGAGFPEPHNRSGDVHAWAPAKQHVQYIRGLGQLLYRAGHTPALASGVALHVLGRAAPTAQDVPTVRLAPELPKVAYREPQPAGGALLGALHE